MSVEISAPFFSPASARYGLVANQTGVNPNASAVKVVFNDVSTAPDFITAGAFASGTYTIPFNGSYDITVVLTVLGTNVLASSYQIRIYKNGSYVCLLGDRQASAGTQFSISGASGPLRFNAGDTMDIYLYGAGNNSTNTLTIFGGSDASFCALARVGT